MSFKFANYIYPWFECTQILMQLQSVSVTGTIIWSQPQQNFLGPVGTALKIFMTRGQALNILTRRHSSLLLTLFKTFFANES